MYYRKQNSYKYRVKEKNDNYMLVKLLKFIYLKD